MAIEVGFRRMARRVDAPAVLLILLVARSDRGQRARHGDAQTQSIDQGGVANGRCLFREPPVVKNRYRP